MKKILPILLLVIVFFVSCDLFGGSDSDYVSNSGNLKRVNINKNSRLEFGNITSSKGVNRYSYMLIKEDAGTKKAMFTREDGSSTTEIPIDYFVDLTENYFCIVTVEYGNYIVDRNTGVCYKLDRGKPRERSLCFEKDGHLYFYSHDWIYPNWNYPEDNLDTSVAFYNETQICMQAIIDVTFNEDGTCNTSLFMRFPEDQSFWLQDWCIDKDGNSAYAIRIDRSAMDSGTGSPTVHYYFYIVDKYHHIVYSEERQNGPDSTMDSLYSVFTDNAGKMYYMKKGKGLYKVNFEPFSYPLLQEGFFGNLYWTAGKEKIMCGKYYLQNGTVTKDLGQVVPVFNNGGTGETMVPNRGEVWNNGSLWYLDHRVYNAETQTITQFKQPDPIHPTLLFTKEELGIECDYTSMGCKFENGYLIYLIHLYGDPNSSYGIGSDGIGNHMYVYLNPTTGELKTSDPNVEATSIAFAQHE